MPEDQNPLAREAELTKQRRGLESAILQALPPMRRPFARLALHTAARRIPLRGIAKDSFVMSLDVLRASARRIGGLLCEQGLIADPADIFFVTDEEITGPRPTDLRGLVERRRERYEYYRSIDVPSQWEDNPAPVDLSPSDPGSGVITGVGVSPGVVEGRARVVLDPDFDEVEPGEILIAPSTDPSWASIMFLSAALIVDIGGALSHAAIVARELGVPCVVNTGTGTRRIRTGDLCRVDGTTGTIMILHRNNDEKDDS